jgi:ELWxxDGT repeat protein
MRAVTQWSVWLALSALAGCGGEAGAEQAGLEARQTRTALAPGPAALVKDINTQSRNRTLVDAQHVHAQGSHVYLAGGLWEPTLDTGLASFIRDVELWRSDGTPEGTVLLKDLSPGGEGSTPRAFTPWREQLFFLASPQDTGLSLWSTNGSPEGTVLRARLQPRAGYSVAGERLVPTRHGLCLALQSGVEQNAELWCKDSSPLGMVRLSGPWEAPGSKGHSLTWRAVQDGTAYFTVDGQLWSTDGSPEGTRHVGQSVPGIDTLSPTSFIPYKDRLYFEATAGIPGLWRTDGTASGTTLVTPMLDVGGGGAAANNTLWLPALASTEGERTQLWKSDGTPEGTTRVATLSPTAELGTASFQPLNATTTLFLTTPPPSTTPPTAAHVGVWRTDGTTEGTVRLAAFAHKTALAVFGGAGYFLKPSPEDYQLWRTDGSLAGTQLVLDLPTGQNFTPITETLSDFNVTPQALFFRTWYSIGARGHFQKLWRTDGTPEGTRPVLDAPGFTADASPEQLVAAGSRVYFAARTPGGGLWTSDGTAEGTVLLSALRLSDIETPHDPDLTPVADGRLFFRSRQGSGPIELWVSNGTPAGTALVTNVPPEELTALGTTLYFRGYQQATGFRLWKSDGTPAGTVEVAQPAGSAYSFPQSLTPVGGLLYFAARTDAGPALWKTDGTAEGTTLVKPLPVANHTALRGFTAADGVLYFIADSTLWKSDGTPEGTVALKAAPSGGGVGPGIVTVGAAAYFRLATPTQGELWRTDGTPEGTVRLAHTALDVEPLAAMQGTLYFQANDGQAGWELWKTNGTTQGTVRVKDLQPRQREGRITGKVLALEAEGRLFFSAPDARGGVEPWVSDGTPGGTGRVQDVAPGAMSSNASGFVRAGERVFFTANDGTHGRELWALPVAAPREHLPPEVVCPTSHTAQAASAQGLAVEYPAAFASAEGAGTPVLSYSHPSGTTFPVGGTTVTVTATEEGAPSATCQFTVTVTPPPPPPPPEPPPLPTMGVVGGPADRVGCEATGQGLSWLALAASAWLTRRRRTR